MVDGLLQSLELLWRKVTRDIDLDLEIVDSRARRRLPWAHGWFDLIARDADVRALDQ